MEFNGTILDSNDSVTTIINELHFVKVDFLTGGWQEEKRQQGKFNQRHSSRNLFLPIFLQFHQTEFLFFSSANMGRQSSYVSTQRWDKSFRCFQRTKGEGDKDSINKGNQAEHVAGSSSQAFTSEKWEGLPPQKHCESKKLPRKHKLLDWSWLISTLW